MATPRDAWRSLMLTSQLLEATVEQQLQREAGMAHSHYALLVALYEHPSGRMPLAELARIARYSQSRLSHAVRSLEHGGWLVREPSPDDARATLARLTDDGVRLVRRIGPLQAREVRARIFAGLDPADLDALTRITGMILTELERDQSPVRRSSSSP